MPRKFVTETTQELIRLVLVIPLENGWGSVGVYVSSKAPEFEVVMRPDSSEKFSQIPAYRTYVCSPNFEEGGSGGGWVSVPSGMSPDAVARFILQDIGVKISEEEHRELWSIVSRFQEDSSLEVFEKENVHQGVAHELAVEKKPSEKLAVSREEVHISRPVSKSDPKREETLRGVPQKVIHQPRTAVQLDHSLEKSSDAVNLVEKRRAGLLGLATLSNQIQEKRAGVSISTRGTFPTGMIRKRRGRGRRGVWRLVSIGVGSILFLLLVSALTGLGYAWKAKSDFVEHVRMSAQAFSGESSAEELKNVRLGLLNEQSRVKKAWSVTSPLLPLLGQGSSDLDFLFGAVEKEASALESLQKSRISSEMLISALWKGGSFSIPQLAQESQLFSEQALKDVSQLSVELQRFQQADEEFPGLEGKEGVNQLQILRKNLSTGQKMAAVLPELIANKKKKTFAVLVQNPSELRATGGYINALILLRFEDGKLANYEVRNVYELDKTLRGFVAPPEELSKLLGEDQWNLREANWSPDFPTVARQVEWFLKKQSGEDVSGVIGLNSYVLLDALSVLGPLKLANGEGVSAQNLLEKSLLKDEVGEGGEMPADGGYLVDVVQTMLKKMSSSSPHQLSKIFDRFGSLAQQGQILLSSAEPSVEKGLDLLGWTGKIMTPSCPVQFSSSSCYVDTLYVVDTNVGINRANYYVKKSMDHSVSLSKDLADHSIALRYTNDSPSMGWPAGVYKNYIRLYVPDFSELRSVAVDGKEVPLDQILVGYENGKRKIALTVSIPPGQSSTVVVKYSTILKASGSFSYAFFVQKQPGTEAFPSSFTMNLLRPLMAKTVAPAADVVDNVVQYDAKMDGHQFMAVEVVE